MIKALFLGAIVLLIAHTLWFISLQFELFISVLQLLLLLSPPLASFVSSYFAPRYKTILGASMVVLSMLITVASNFLYQLKGGMVDFPGYKGAYTLATLMLLFYIIPCVIGALAGDFVSRKKQA